LDVAKSNDEKQVFNLEWPKVVFFPDISAGSEGVNKFL